MQDNANSALPALKRIPWNKGKLTGAKPPLRPKHVWSIRTKLQVEGTNARLGDVQTRYRQQTAWLRCGRPQGRGCCSERILSRSGNRATKKGRAACQVRIDGADPTSSR